MQIVLTLSSVLHHPFAPHKKFEDLMTSLTIYLLHQNPLLRTLSGEIVKMRADYINPVMSGQCLLDDVDKAAGC